MVRYGWYGDDFTGATDTLATLSEAGLGALLFLKIPTPGQYAAAGPLDAMGIAGAARSMAPDSMAMELDAVGTFFADSGVEVMHYKCCSTFDSAPHVGSIGAAVKALRPHFANPLVPILGGQPNLGRYCLFGTLFAAAGSGGAIHRIDRHPTMSVHPVTPMGEADLRLHLAAQGLTRIALLDYLSYGAPTISDALKNCLSAPLDAVLMDVSRTEDLGIIGPLLWDQARSAPMLAVGPSSVAQALSRSWPGEKADSTAASTWAKRIGSVLALVGSLSPITRAQVEATKDYEQIAIDPVRLIGDLAYAEDIRQQAILRLASCNTMLVTEKPLDAPEQAGKVAVATGLLLRDILAETSVSRLIVAGGDTSSLAVRSLDIWGLSYRAPLVPGAPLCQAHSDDPKLQGLEIILKGGQMGPVDFFTQALPAYA